MPSEDYRQWVYRVWDQLVRSTGRKPCYLDATHIGSYCPACLDGIIRIGFVTRPELSITVTSNTRPGCCTEGCAEAAVARALFA
jgi:hypothetical protein